MRDQTWGVFLPLLLVVAPIVGQATLEACRLCRGSIVIREVKKRLRLGRNGRF